MSKSSKRRHCPAVQREIGAPECGESRVSRYACPVECAFNPFGPSHYDQFSETEAMVTRKALHWYLGEPAGAARSRELDARVALSYIEQNAWQISEFHFRRDDQGRTCAERWAAAGLPGLNNDERVIQSAMRRQRTRLIEVHRILDDRMVEAVDLFEPGSPPFLICDRGLAAEACRFSTILGSFYPLPHYWRPFAISVLIPSIATFEPTEVVSEIVRRLGGPADPAARDGWFGLNYARFFEALDAVSLARRGQLLAAMDAEFCQALYELRAPFAECREALDASEEVSDDEMTEAEESQGFAEARAWIEQVDAPEQFVLGRVLLGQKHWQVDAIGHEKFNKLRAGFEKILGRRVHFTGECRHDLSAQLRSKEKQYDPALVPPRLLENPSGFLLTSSRVPTSFPHGSLEELQSQIMDRYDRAWLDESVPTLEGRTPREASRNPALRPVLIRLLKDRVRSVDERNLETGGTADVNWLLKELGADEILFDPPPARAPAKYADEDMGDEDPAESLEPWPVPPSKPFGATEARDLLSTAMAEFESFADAESAMEDAGGFLIEDVHECFGHLLEEGEITFLSVYLVQIWFAFVPPNCFGPEIDPGEWRAEFERELKLGEEAAKAGPEAGSRFLAENSAQPAMVRVLAGDMVSRSEQLPGVHVPREHMPVLLLVLRSVIEVLDARCREPFA